jgi:hypothetical protein
VRDGPRPGRCSVGGASPLIRRAFGPSQFPIDTAQGTPCDWIPVVPGHAVHTGQHLSVRSAVPVTIDQVLETSFGIDASLRARGMLLRDHFG